MVKDLEKFNSFPVVHCVSGVEIVNILVLEILGTGVSGHSSTNLPRGAFCKFLVY